MTENSKAKRYENIKLILGLTETILSVVILIIFIFSGYSKELRDIVSGWAVNPYWRLLAFIGVLGAAFSLISFPLSYISKFWLEHHYNLSNQTFFAWLLEKIKAFALTIILFVPIIILFYYFLRNYPESWWFWMASVLFVFSVVIGRIAPQVIFPLFYKFELINDEDIVKRMKNLAKKGRFALSGVYRFNMSKTTKKANAAFTGLGKSKRIIIGDTLLDKFSIDEIEAVFAHEAGHYVHKHILIGIITGTLSSYITLYAAHLIYQYSIIKMGYQSPDDLAAIPLLSIILTVISFITMPVFNALSRRHEYQADRYALQNSSNPQAFITSMQKLSETNLTDKSPHPLVEFLFHAHPSTEKRIQAAEGEIED